MIKFKINNKFIYLISPNKIKNNIFYNQLVKIFKLNKVVFFQLRLKKEITKNKITIGKKIKKILGNKIIGITCHNSKKLIKKAIKNKASYIAIGAFFLTKTKKVKHKANFKILSWAKKSTNIPIVAIGGINFDNYKKLLLNKANFLAISSYIWNNKKNKPWEALKKLK